MLSYDEVAYILYTTSITVLFVNFHIILFENLHNMIGMKGGKDLGLRKQIVNIKLKTIDFIFKITKVITFNSDFKYHSLA